MDDKNLAIAEVQSWGFPYGLTLVISTHDDGETCLAIQHDVKVDALEKSRPFRGVCGTEAEGEITAEGEPSAVSRWFERLKAAIRSLAPESAAEEVRSRAPHLLDRAR
jgi:hypothetical protein